MSLCLPDAVFWTEVDLGLPIGTPHHDLIQLRVPETPHHTLSGDPTDHVTHPPTLSFRVPTSHVIHHVDPPPGSNESHDTPPPPGSNESYDPPLRFQ